MRRAPISQALCAPYASSSPNLTPVCDLAVGRLTGKYSARREPQGRRGFSASPMRELEPLLTKLRDVAARHSCTPAQVALAWVASKGAIPIPGAKNAEQAAENAGALRCQLAAEEVEELAQLGRVGKTSNWQHA